MMSEFPARVVYAPWTGDALNLAIQAVEREYFVLNEAQRVESDLKKTRETSELGSFIVLAMGDRRTRPRLLGALPVSIEGTVGVLRTRLLTGDLLETEDRARINYGLVGAALSHLTTVNGVSRVGVEAPALLQQSYLLHGLAIGATVELATVKPIKRVTNAT